MCCVVWCAGGELQVDEDLAAQPRAEEERLTEAEKNQRLHKQLEVCTCVYAFLECTCIYTMCGCVTKRQADKVWSRKVI